MLRMFFQRASVFFCIVSKSSPICLTGYLPYYWVAGFLYSEHKSPFDFHSSAFWKAKVINVDEIQRIFKISLCFLCTLRNLCLALDHEEFSMFSSRNVMFLALVFYFCGHFAFIHGCAWGWYSGTSNYSTICGQDHLSRNETPGHLGGKPIDHIAVRLFLILYFLPSLCQ